MAISMWTLERLEQLANRDVIEDWSTWYDLQSMAAELCVEYRKLAGLPEAIIPDDEEDEE